MEFETSPPPSDEERQLAAIKQVTLAPIHADVAPEDDPSVERNVELAAPMNNIMIDNEDTADRTQLESTSPADPHTEASQTTRSIHWTAVLGAASVCILFGGVMFAVWYLNQ